MKCKKGVMWKDSTAGFVHHGLEECLKLARELQDGTYQERPHKFFTVADPKRREIMSIAFRDRVYQRSLNDNILYPTMTKSFIRDNCACQKKLGTDYARNRLECFLHRHYRKHGLNGYVLQIDVKGYYPNMRHDVAKACFAKKIDGDAYVCAARILDGFPGDVGFNPGSQILQIAGVSVPNEIDHYIKERLRCKHYVRYMDDMILIAKDKAYLKRCLQEIRQRFEAIGMTLHPDKTRIYPLKEGISFLGFRFILTDTGKVIRKMLSARVRHERRKLPRLVAKAKRGEITKQKADDCFRSWLAHAENGDNEATIRRMKRYYNDLWKQPWSKPENQKLVEAGLPAETKAKK